MLSKGEKVNQSRVFSKNDKGPVLSHFLLNNSVNVRHFFKFCSKMHLNMAFFVVIELLKNLQNMILFLILFWEKRGDCAGDVSTFYGMQFPSPALPLNPQTIK